MTTFAFRIGKGFTIIVALFAVQIGKEFKTTVALFALQIGHLHFKLENNNGIHQQEQEIKITSHNVSYAIFLSFLRINLTLYLNTSLHVHGFDTLVLPYNTI